ncbi:MAG: GDP-mannose 4,6-dehydratase [Niabella sp.]
MKAIIFGISGQDGYYLSSILQAANIEVIGVSRRKDYGIQGNVGDYAFVAELIKQHQPDYIFHLAANSVTVHHVQFENHETISTGTLNILEVVYKHSPATKVFLSGSAVQFQNNNAPINEQTPFAALSAYAVARIQSVYAARYYKSLGIKAYVGYFFNHDSPLRHEKHINKQIVDAVLRMQQGSDEVMEIGNWNVKKEFNYARDCMQAIWTLVNQESVFEAVIGSGQAYTIRQWIEICCNEAGIPLAVNQFVQSEKFKAEYKILVSNPALIKSLGWKPEVDIKELAKMMLKK